MILKVRRADVYRLLLPDPPLAVFFIDGNQLIVHAGDCLNNLFAEEIHLFVGRIDPVGQLLY